MPTFSRSKKTLSSAETPAPGIVDGRVPRRAEGRVLLAIALLALAPMAVRAAGQASPAAAELTAHVASLSSLDFPTRMHAARMIRRAPAAEAVPVLREAVASHRDEFVRYRAFVVLSSFDDRRTAELVPGLLADRNDRLREAAYKWLEAHPDRRLTETLLRALQTEQAEFVRPALVGALAALGDSLVVQRALLMETARGLDFFRGAVIDALGRHRAAYAADAIAAVARLDGPLQDDAVLALGRIGGARARAALATIPDGPADLMVSVRAAQCLHGEGCEASIAAIVEAATAPRASTALLRAAVGALATLAAGEYDAGMAALIDLGGRGGAVRAQAALGLATAAVRNPAHTVAWLDAAREELRTSAIDLLKDGFDDLEEDFGEEQFFAATRAAYWEAPEASPTRAVAATLIERLEF